MNEVAASIQTWLKEIEDALGGRLLRWHAAHAGWAIEAGELVAVARTAGKRLRPRFMFIVNGMCGGAYGPAIRDAAEALELYHCSSLLFDDVQDNARTRRGEPAHYMTYSVSATLSLCVMLSRHVNLLLLESEALKPAERLWILQRFTRAQLATGLGQMAETVCVRDEVLDLPIEKYWRTVQNKTASLFAFAAEAGAYLGSGGDETVAAAYRDMGDQLGILFQLVDDYADLFLPDNEGKPRCQDIREAKRTLFFLHARKTLPADRLHEFDRLCLLATRNEDQVQWMLRQMRESGAPEAGRGHVRRLAGEVQAKIDGLARQYSVHQAYEQELRALVDEICRGLA